MRWRLEVTTWRGLSRGAKHWYGRLHQVWESNTQRTGPDTVAGVDHPHVFDVMRALSTVEAAELTVEDDWRWEAGDTTARCPTRRSVIQAAIAQFLEDDRVAIGDTLHLDDRAKPQRCGELLATR